MSIGTGIKIKEEESKKSQGHGIAFAIEESKADNLYFLCTKESKDTLNYVKEYLSPEKKIIFRNKHIKILSGMSDINTLIKEMKEVFDEIKENKITVVPVFGTKMMTSSLTILGILYNAKIYSVEGERINGIVKEGTEKWESQNYYRIMNMFYLEKTLDLFNKYQYTAADEYLNKI